MSDSPQISMEDARKIAELVVAYHARTGAPTDGAELTAWDLAHSLLGLFEQYEDARRKLSCGYDTGTGTNCGECLDCLKVNWHFAQEAVKNLKEQYENAIYERDLHVTAGMQLEREKAGLLEQLEAAEEAAHREHMAVEGWSLKCERLQEQLEAVQRASDNAHHALHGATVRAERLEEQLEAMREALRETIELIESEGFSFHYEERQEWIRLADSGAAGAYTPSDSFPRAQRLTPRVSAPETSFQDSAPASEPSDG